MFSSLKLSSVTVVGRQQQKKLNLIISYLIDTPQSAEFLHPVQWEDMELNDYPMVVKHPMNLLKVQQKLKNHEYQTVEQILDHIQLIWDNCKSYNPQGPFYILAEKMQRAYKKMIKNYLPNIQIVIPSKTIFNVGTTNVIKNNPSQTPNNNQNSNQNNNSTNKNISTKSHKKIPNPLHHHQTEQTQNLVDPIQMQEIPLSEKNRFHQRLKQLTQQQLAQVVIIIQDNCLQGFKQFGSGRCQILMDFIDLETFRKINQKIDQILDHEKLTNHSNNKKIKI